MSQPTAPRRYMAVGRFPGKTMFTIKSCAIVQLKATNVGRLEDADAGGRIFHGRFQRR